MNGDGGEWLIVSFKRERERKKAGWVGQLVDGVVVGGWC